MDFFDFDSDENDASLSPKEVQQTRKEIFRESLAFLRILKKVQKRRLWKLPIGNSSGCVAAHR